MWSAAPKPPVNREWMLTFGYFSDTMAAGDEAPELLVAAIEVNSQCDPEHVWGVAALMIEEDVHAMTSAAAAAGWRLEDCFWSCEPKHKLEVVS